MIEQVATTLYYLAHYTIAGVGKTGLTDVAPFIYKPDHSLATTPGFAVELGHGLYIYAISGQSTTAGVYGAVFNTADVTVDAREVPAAWFVGPAWAGHMNADISSRSTYAGGAVASVTAPVVASAVIGNVGGDVVGDVNGSVGSVVTGVFVSSVGDKTGYSLEVPAPTAEENRIEMDQNSTKLADLVYITNTDIYDAISLTRDVAEITVSQDYTGWQLIGISATTGGGQSAIITSASAGVLHFAAGWSRGATPSGTLYYGYAPPSLDKSGYRIDLTQPLADVKTGTVGGALHGAWLVAWGKIVKNPIAKTLALFGIGSQSVPIQTFNLDDGTSPNTRTPQ